MSKQYIMETHEQTKYFKENHALAVQTVHQKFSKHKLLNEIM